jgi:hypothetical protein
MIYTFTPPAGNSAQDATWETITLSLPADTPLAVPADPARWERRNGRIIVSYTQEELRAAVGLALDQQRRGLEARLERGLEMMRAAAGGDDAQAERLSSHWNRLMDRYADLVGKIERV